MAAYAGFMTHVTCRLTACQELTGIISSETLRLAIEMGYTVHCLVYARRNILA